MWRDLALGFLSPSPPGQTPEQAIVRGLAHAVMGGLLSVWPPLIAGYVAKEAWDAWRGGSLVDGGFDLAFVALGLVCLPWAPCAAIIALGLTHAFVVHLSTG